MGLVPSLMTWRVTKPHDNDFCLSDITISPTDVLQHHDEEMCEEIVTALASDGFRVDKADIQNSLDHAFTVMHGQNSGATTLFHTKRLWTPPDFDPTDMYDSFGHNFSASTDSVLWFSNADQKMSDFAYAYRCQPDDKPALKRSVGMFVANNLNYLTTCLDEELGIEDDYAYLPHDEWDHERVLLRV